MPTYLVITQDQTREEQRRTARRACVAMIVLLAFFAATGTLIFQVFGITLPAFRIAGGLILWFVAMDMLRASGGHKGARKKFWRGKPKKTWP